VLAGFLPIAAGAGSFEIAQAGPPPPGMLAGGMSAPVGRPGATGPGGVGPVGRAANGMRARWFGMDGARASAAWGSPQPRTSWPSADGGRRARPPSAPLGDFERPAFGSAPDASPSRPTPGPPDGFIAGPDRSLAGMRRAFMAAPALRRFPQSPLDAAVFASAYRAETPSAQIPSETVKTQPLPAPAQAVIAPTIVEQVASASAGPAPTTTFSPAPAPTIIRFSEARGVPLAPPPVARSLFGIAAPTAYVAGEFVAARRTSSGWITVRPRPEGFPNSWQRRIFLWFALSLALVGPAAFLIARSLTTPYARFADAAERLGRNPIADLPPLDGPGEFGRAADAFNLMRLRLRRYVEDRTGMVSAITHDLRTPLARMRFKLERAPAGLRASLTRDVAQMESMISSVLAFMRDELTGGVREAADLRSILECVVDEFGDRAELAPGPAVIAQVDLLGLQRVFENLVDNAVKYGGQARVSMVLDGEDALIEIADDGPGLPAAELETVFTPFYRGSAAMTSGAPGVGLGLAVARSVMRGHGGDVTLHGAERGLVARVRLPAAEAAKRAA
jgi:two-component system, OmpR family, sensor kinase